MGYHRDLQRFAAREIYQIQNTLYEAVPCTYCGMPATDKEHVFPQTYIASAHEILGVPFANFAIVPSCRECNSLSGRTVFTGIQEKRQFIKEKLKQRYRKVLEIPQWMESELSELSPELARYVRHGLKLREIILSRLRWRRGSGIANNVEKVLSQQEIPKSFVKQDVDQPSTMPKFTQRWNGSKAMRKEKHRKCQKVSDEAVRSIREQYKTGKYSQTAIGDAFGVSVTVVSLILSRQGRFKRIN